MSNRLRDLLKTATEQKAELDRLAMTHGGFAYVLASQSLATHIDELTQQISIQDSRPILEFLELRLKANQFEGGSAPLRVIAKITEKLRQMFGYAALRLTRGAISRKRVPDSVYDDLDLRLAALLPGSSRLVITSTANRDLWGDGLSKSAFERFFRVLESEGKGSDFLESINDFGPAGSKHLLKTLNTIRNETAEVDISWRYAGSEVRKWVGNAEKISDVCSALGVTEVNLKSEDILSGVVELLSKRERIHLKSDSGEVVRVLFPKSLLPIVSGLHLDQRVKLRCSVTETENPSTGESSIFHELLEIVS
jgi:hypothetical protein